MSLINKMLRDLSARESKSGQVLSGIQVARGAAAAPQGTNWGRLGLMIVLVAAFAGVFWLLLGRHAAAPRAPEQAPAPITASAAPAGPSRFQLSTTMAAPSAGAHPHHKHQPAADTAAATSAPSAAPARSVDATAPGETAPAAVAAATPPAAPPAPAKPAPQKPANAADARKATERANDGTAALGRGEPTTAEQAFREALALDPANRSARESLIVLLLDQDRQSEAQKELDEGLAIAPDYVPYRRLAARLDLARGQPEAAVRRLEPSAPPVGADPEYHGLLASAYQRLGRHEDAARVYQRLTEVQPNEAHWWAGYGLSRDALGDASGALAAYAQARSLGHLEPRVLEHINQRAAALTAGG